jgi:hypothetical protein
MTVLRLPVYRSEPRSPEIMLAGGVARTETRDVPLIISTSDYGTGYNNIAEMKVWGDLDPGFHPEYFGTTEGTARWQPFAPLKQIVLSAGNGTKSVSAKIRNGTGVETSILTDTVELATSAPHASILWSDGVRAPMMDGVIQFGWSSSHDFAAAAVCVVPSLYSEYGDGTVLTMYPAGSAGEHQWFLQDVDTFLSQDLYPSQSGEKPIKVFVQVDGTWF